MLKVARPQPLGGPAHPLAGRERAVRAVAQPFLALSGPRSPELGQLGDPAGAARLTAIRSGPRVNVLTTTYELSVV
ncbi:hypothetical protein GCM10020295_20100 [Streptomyces cinereospinus]